MIDPERLAKIAAQDDKELERQIEVKMRILDRHAKAGPKDRSIAHAAIHGLVAKAEADLDAKLYAFRARVALVGAEVGLGDVSGMAGAYLLLDPAFRQLLHDKIDAETKPHEANPYGGAAEWEAKGAEIRADMDAIGAEQARRQAKREQEAERLAALASR